MNLGQILQLVGALPTIIATVESVRGNGGGATKRSDVKNAVLGSVATMEAVNRLNVKDRKKFNKGLDGVIDGIVTMLNSSEWKA